MGISDDTREVRLVTSSVTRETVDKVMPANKIEVTCHGSDMTNELQTNGFPHRLTDQWSTVDQASTAEEATNLGSCANTSNTCARSSEEMDCTSITIPTSLRDLVDNTLLHRNRRVYSLL